ncbi:MAG: 50S ribosomal protein L16 [Kiritimatiellae bacterium]|nr:50S ribosomal protein L16 [Kiritimatiellia bacterium]MBP5225894.1 50S ribosomal protein L16 [Kiritimatiellia bacterium]MBP5226189.1 50S ribosomal protein L16 [Kiritimatiellia bacterium]
MPLMPKRVKHRKQSKGNRAGYATSGAQLAYGEYGLKSLDRGFLTNTQIEACRVVINREMKRKGKLWIRIFPDKPVTRKPIEVRMGGGKGNPELWVAVILPGKILFEVGGVSEAVARECLRLADTKLGLRTMLVSRNVPTGA